jgi:iron complex outermembrane receptor protein
VVTDVDGNFSLSVSNVAHGVLQLSYVGFSSLEVRVNGRSKVDVQLEQSVVNLGEVVAIGYGTQTRREITGSVANVSQESFNKGVTRDAADLLQGKVAGLSITTGSSDVTRGSQIRLRGVSTLQNDQGPMIVIDGVPGGDMSTVAPSDIESISVLKDASSAAIYGSRAAGGVILITTKRGSGSKTQVNYDAYVTIDRVANKPDLLNASEWREANKFLGNGISDFDTYNADTDWFGEMLRTGVSQNHSISLSGGGPKNNYRASYTFLDRNGIARDNSLRRHNFRFQFQQRAINDRLRIGLTGSATMAENRFPFKSNYLLAYTTLPVYPVRNEDGSFFTGMMGAYDQGNPVQNQESNYHGNKVNSFYGSGDIQFSITEDLNLKAHLYKSMNSTDRSFWVMPGTATEGASVSTGQAERQASSTERNLMEWTANYSLETGKQKFEAIGGYSWENNLFQDQKSIASDFSVSSMGANSIQSGNTLKIGNVTSAKNEYKLISFFARAHYSFDEKYMVTATVRRDGSSKFGKNNKWGTFPSVSAAWGLSQEAFMRDIQWISDLKLRAGYGVTGNQDGLAPYKTLELYRAAGTYYDDGNAVTAFKISQNANPDLKWESTAMLNVGLDFSLFNGRLGGSLEWYNKKTSDMLYTYKVPTPPYVYDRMQANVGDMENTGVELLLNLDVIRRKTFSWNTSVNLAHNVNKILSLSNDLYTTDRVDIEAIWIRGASNTTTHVVEVGRPVGQFFMPKCLGFDEDGKLVYQTANSDGVPTSADYTYVGSAQPVLSFGWNNTFSWKRWDASFFIRGTIGNKVFNAPSAAYGNYGKLSGANAMKTENQMKIESPKISSFYVEDASFARLDNMSIGYTFDVKKAGWMEKARVYIAAQNLFVITGYTGLDPEVELFTGNASDENAGLTPGVEPRDYSPKARSFTMGINFIF